MLYNVPESEAETAREIIEEAMTDAIPQLGVPMPVDIEVTRYWCEARDPETGEYPLVKKKILQQEEEV